MCAATTAKGKLRLQTTIALVKLFEFQAETISGSGSDSDVDPDGDDGCPARAGPNNFSKFAAKCPSTSCIKSGGGGLPHCRKVASNGCGRPKVCNMPCKDAIARRFGGCALLQRLCGGFVLIDKCFGEDCSMRAVGH